MPRALKTVAALTIALALASCGSSRNVYRDNLELVRFVMPVRGVQPSDLKPNFGDARDGGARRHDGLDIMAPMGREILAPCPGKIIAKKWNDRGGNSIWMQGNDGRFYYFAHLSRYADGLKEGEQVRAANVIGYVGNTGDAQGKSPHLHFEIHNARNGPPLNPYPILRQDGILVMALPVAP